MLAQEKAGPSPGHETYIYTVYNLTVFNTNKSIGFDGRKKRRVEGQEALKRKDLKNLRTAEKFS